MTFFDFFIGKEFPINFMLVVVLIFALIYEAINGFHDTATAVATVIYTHTLRPKLAVILSGILNFFGVLMGGLSVAYAIVHLLPINVLLDLSSKYTLIMMFSMLLAAILWNLGTWYFGLPASSSHTLIGAILGVGLANAIVNSTPILYALNIPKLIEIILSLLISPILGAVLSGIIILFLRNFWKKNLKFQSIHLTPEEQNKKNGKLNPPNFIRALLIFSSSGVSFAHGANDGQKGIGLVMLLLIGLMPKNYIININATKSDILNTKNAINKLHVYYINNYHLSKKNCKKEKSFLYLKNNNIFTENKEKNFYRNNKNSDFFISKNKFSENRFILEDSFDLRHVLSNIDKAAFLFKNLNSYKQLNFKEQSDIRKLLMFICNTTEKLFTKNNLPKSEKQFLKNQCQCLLSTIEYTPMWIIIIVALSLSIGTMIGWNRTMITIGEKIGKKNMTYAQGLSAQVTTAVSISIASYTGIPVSTTHVLSSAVMGSMLADGYEVQKRTIKNIALAWILTFPIAIMLSGGLYLSLIYFFLERKN